jgi:hypothetical protein
MFARHRDVCRHSFAAAVVATVALSVISGCGSDQPSTEPSTSVTNHTLAPAADPTLPTIVESPSSSTPSTTIGIINAAPPLPTGDFYVPPDPLLAHRLGH